MKLDIRATLKRIKEDIINNREILIVLPIYYLVVKKVFHAFCPMVIAVGLPCPGCGMTRALIYMLRGDVVRSLMQNPTLILWLAMIAYMIWMRYIRLEVIKGITIIVSIVVIITIVAYLYRMITIYPTRPPMSYTGGNLLEKGIRLLR